MAKDQFSIRTRSIIEISCAFCSSAIREDVKDRAEDPYDNQEYHFAVKANGQGWCFLVTTDGHILNLCPDHAQTMNDAELPIV